MVPLRTAHVSHVLLNYPRSPGEEQHFADSTPLLTTLISVFWETVHFLNGCLKHQIRRLVAQTRTLAFVTEGSSVQGWLVSLWSAPSLETDFPHSDLGSVTYSPSKFPCAALSLDILVRRKMRPSWTQSKFFLLLFSKLFPLWPIFSRSIYFK